MIAVFRPFRIANGYRFTQWVSPFSIWLMGAHFEIRNRERIGAHPPEVIVGNHQSNYDLYLYGYLFPPQSVTIGKRSLRWVPIFGWLYLLSGHILIDRGRHDKAALTIRQTSNRLKRESLSVLIFPEGTRSKGGPMGPFKKGAFHIAVETGYPIVPIAMSSYAAHSNFWAWRSGKVIAEILDPILTVNKTAADIAELIALAHARIADTVKRLDAEIAAEA